MAHQIRPDKPRSVRGRIVKYETPAGGRLSIDVPPTARPWLGDPNASAAEATAIVAALLAELPAEDARLVRRRWLEIAERNREVRAGNDREAEVLRKPRVLGCAPEWAERIEAALGPVRQAGSDGATTSRGSGFAPDATRLRALSN